MKAMHTINKIIFQSIQQTKVTEMLTVLMVFEKNKGKCLLVKSLKTNPASSLQSNQTLAQSWI